MGHGCARALRLQADHRAAADGWDWANGCGPGAGAAVIGTLPGRGRNPMLAAALCVAAAAGGRCPSTLLSVHVHKASALLPELQ
jgi:hypothetical protein